MSEISGIIKNASERGWAINEIKQSLVNAGYPSQDIDFEISRSSSNYQESSMPQAEQTLSSLSPKNLSNYQTPEQPKSQPSHTKLIVIVLTLLVLSVLTGIALFFLLP